MEYGIQCVCPAGPGYERVYGPVPPAGSWLAAYDPDGGPDGQGSWEFNDDPSAAMRFVSPQAAMRTWRAVSQRRPTRRDGRPNRPLTALTVLVSPLPDVD